MKPRLVTIDTLAQVMPGGDENNSVDMGKVLLACRRIHEATGAMVLLVHHSGKDVGKGARGWSGLRAAADVELEVSKDERGNTLRITKMKDDEGDLQFPFRLRSIDLEFDGDGDAITSCVVEHVDGGERLSAPLKRLGINEKRLLNVLQRFALSGPTGVSDLIDATLPEIPFDTTGLDGKPKRDQRRDHLQRALNQLIDKGLVVIADNRVSLRADDASRAPSCFTKLS